MDPVTAITLPAFIEAAATVPARLTTPDLEVARIHGVGFDAVVHGPTPGDLWWATIEGPGLRRSLQCQRLVDAVALCANVVLGDLEDNMGRPEGRLEVRWDL